MAKISWLHFAAQLLQIPQTYRIEVNLVQAMDFQSLELFSVACLELYLVRNFETQKPRPETFNKLWSNFPDGRRFTHHTFMKFVITWSLFLIREWSQRCMQRPKEKPFQQTSWIKNIIEKNTQHVPVPVDSDILFCSYKMLTQTRQPRCYSHEQGTACKMNTWNFTF